MQVNPEDSPPDIYVTWSNPRMTDFENPLSYVNVMILFQSTSKSNQDKDSGNQSSDSSLMSPDRSFNQSNLFSPQRLHPPNLSSPVRAPASPTKQPSKTSTEIKIGKSTSDIISSMILANLSAIEKEKSRGWKPEEKTVETSKNEKTDDPFSQIKTPPTPDLSEAKSQSKPQSSVQVSETNATSTKLSLPKTVKVVKVQKFVKVKAVPKIDEVIEISSSSDEEENKTPKAENVQKEVSSTAVGGSNFESAVSTVADKSNVEAELAVKDVEAENKVTTEATEMDCEESASDANDKNVLPDIDPVKSPESDCGPPGAYLDPTTGLFVTDSDSQSSNFVANPENLSFDVDELMDVDNWWSASS